MTEPNEKKIYLRFFFYLNAIFLLSLSMGMNTILFPVAMDNLKFTESAMGLVMAAETIAALMVCLGLQWIFNRVGLALAILFALFFRLYSLFELSSSQDSMQWMLYIFIHGIGAYLMVIILQTLVTGLSFTRHKALVNSLFGASVSLGYSIGPLIIEALNNYNLPVNSLSEHFGLMKAAQLGSLCMSAAAGIILILTGLNGRNTSSNNQVQRLSLLSVIHRSPGVYGAVASAGVAVYGIMAFITIYGLRNNMDIYHASLLLSVFMAGSIVLEPVYAWISSHFNLRYFLFTNTFVSLSFSAFLSIAVYDFTQVAIILFLWGGSNASIYSVALTILTDKFKKEELVAANAAFSLMDNLGGTLGVICIGLAMQYFGSEGLSYVIIAASIIYFSFGLTRYKII